MENTRILVVEDEAIVAKDIEGSLKNLGYAVCGRVYTGEEAIQKVTETQPDLVLMDILLKGDMDGIETAQQIRTRFNIPVVYLTAHADEKTLRRAKMTQPYGYLTKPFEEKELYTATEVGLYKHKMESELREKEQWLATIVESIAEAVIVTDRQGLVTFMNFVAETLTGWKQEEALGKSFTEIFNIKCDETHDSIDDPIAEVIQKDVVLGLTESVVLSAKDGREIPISYAASPLKDDRENIIGAVLVCSDVTEYEQAERGLNEAHKELKEVQEELIQSEKLAALGSFASGIAHAVKNPLGIILGGTEFLERKLSKSPSKPDRDTKTAIEKVKESVFRADSAIQGLLRFASQSELRIERTKVDDLINETLSLLKYRAPLKKIEIRTEFPKEVIQVEVDRSQMQQVLLNLLMNAVEAMPEGGEITVKSYKTVLSKFSLEKAVCVIEIIDTGVGIPEDNLSRLFEPFFTTKNDTKGTGLGLCMAKMILESHKGNLIIESEHNKGTNAKVILTQSESI